MTTAPDFQPDLTPARIFETFNAYQRAAALKAAVDLDIFSSVAEGNRTSAAVARAAGVPERGARILCDYLAILGFLSKSDSEYALTPESAVFLDRNSPAYIGEASRFLFNPELVAPFFNLTEVVRSGRTTLPDQGTVTRENPLWVDFARYMAPMVRPAAAEMAPVVCGEGPVNVLDVAAGHGFYGICIAQSNPQARVTALDWPDVLAVALENARDAGVTKRYQVLPGDAFEVPFGGPYDLVLLTNFLHHYDVSACETLLRKVYAALVPGGRCATLDFVPNEDRVTPAIPAAFALTMLGTTPAGDAYTFSEYDTMARNAGFASSELHRLAKAPQSLVISTKV
jgi:ubiquinone/menaquinone biosynthesis C-methylase UbiE